MSASRTTVGIPLPCHGCIELSGIYVPDPEDEAIRDLARARNDARLAERKAKQRLNSFLLRNNLMYPRKTKWNMAYFYRSFLLDTVRHISSYE
jgi:hypothetical protein